MLSIMRQSTTKHSIGRTTPAARRILCAAAFGSLSSSSWAFVAPQHSVPATIATMRPLQHGQSYPMQPQTMAQHHQTRLFMSQRDDSDWETFKRAGGNLLKKGANKIKSIIPFVKSDETRAQIAKKERKQEIKGGINTMLKDAPLPIRMMGRMIAPLMARAAEGIAEQAQQAQEMMKEARLRLANDPMVAEQLGEPLQVGQPFSQSSATTVINGQSSARVKASFQVAGPRGSGVATMESSNGEIVSLNVNVNGRNISVGSSRGGKSIYGKSSSSKKNDNIVEAEIIEAEIIEKK